MEDQAIRDAYRVLAAAKVGTALTVFVSGRRVATIAVAARIQPTR